MSTTTNGVKYHEHVVYGHTEPGEPPMIDDTLEQIKRLHEEVRDLEAELRIANGALRVAAIAYRNSKGDTSCEGALMDVWLAQAKAIIGEDTP